LQERQLAIGEIAFLLGFSEPSAFHRAFKRWTGHAPLDYRDMGQTSAARVPS
jgi:AraC-like DNA-binding protein